jgi:hypothetical protein
MGLPTTSIPIVLDTDVVNSNTMGKLATKFPILWDYVKVCSIVLENIPYYWKFTCIYFQ